jgi:hypothetical protein
MISGQPVKRNRKEKSNGLEQFKESMVYTGRQHMLESCIPTVLLRRIHTYHAVPLPCRSFPFDLHSAAVFDSHIPWHGMCESALRVNQTRPHCVNQMRKTQYKPLAEGQGRGTAWDQHVVCESAFIRRPNVVTHREGK